MAGDRCSMKDLAKLAESDSRSKTAPTHGRAITRRPAADSEAAFQSAGIQQTAGNFAVQRLFKSGALQAKPSISRPDDPYEREADDVANEVMHAPAPRLARKCASCESTGSSCTSCAAEPEETMQRKSASAESTTGRSDGVRSIYTADAGAPLS